MLVDSSGSRKPLDRPTATQFFTQACGRTPGVKRTMSAKDLSARLWINSPEKALMLTGTLLSDWLWRVAVTTMSPMPVSVAAVSAVAGGGPGGTVCPITGTAPVASAVAVIHARTPTISTSCSLSSLRCPARSTPPRHPSSRGRRSRRRLWRRGHSRAAGLTAAAAAAEAAPQQLPETK